MFTCCFGSSVNVIGLLALEVEISVRVGFGGVVRQT